MSMSLGPSASDPTSLTSTRKSLIMERIGDSNIVKRSFKTFQKSYDFTSSVDEQKLCSVSSLPATRQKENGRPRKSSHLEKVSGSSAVRFSPYGLKSNNTAENKQKEISTATPVEKTRWPKNSKAGVIDVRTRRDSLKPKAKHMQGSLPIRTFPKGSS
ncbi:hypothetical protein Bca4012_055057 [Brassica carinata]